jgi:hypothetical protein
MIPTLVLLLTNTVLPADTAPMPRLIAKGETYLVHVIPATPPAKNRPVRSMLVTHTRRDSGVMTVLAEAGAPPFPGLHGDFMRASWDTRSIGGVRADDQRVYILTSHSKGFSTPAMGAHGTVTTELRVFWLADGSAAGRWPIEDLKARRAYPVLEVPTDAGPLRGTVGGVVLDGRSFVFDGKKLVKGAADIPTDAPAPPPLAGGSNYRIVAVSPLPVPPGLAEKKGREVVGISIVYIPLPDGGPKTLLQTGDRPGAPDGTKEGGATQTRVVAVTWDAERLYVLVWHGKWERPGLAMGMVPPLSVLAPSDDYRLYTFWLADGSDLAPVRVRAKEAKVPPEELKRDLMERLGGGGVKVFGQTVRFDGKALVKDK